MAETHVVFQTITIGWWGGPGKYSYLRDSDPILIADVKPFHIVGGHVSTDLHGGRAVLKALRLERNESSIPIYIDFQKPTMNLTKYEHNCMIQEYLGLSYVKLSQKLHGYYVCTDKDWRPIYIDIDLEDVTHLFFVPTQYGRELPEYRADRELGVGGVSVSMTLILEADLGRETPARGRRIK